VCFKKNRAHKIPTRQVEKLKSIVYLEPQCSDKEHALFNAAVINRIDADIDNVYIFADRYHLAALEKLIKVPNKCFAIPMFPAGGVTRVIHFLKCFTIVFRKKGGGSNLTVLSMSTLQLILVSIYALVFQRVTIFHHSLVENLYAENPFTRCIYHVLFRYLGSVKKIQNIFLGAHVKDNLEKLGLTKRNFVFMRLPFEAGLKPLPQDRSKNPFKVLNFGKQTFKKGFRDNLWLWENLNSRGIDCQIAGFANQEVIEYLKIENSNLHLSDTMCDQEELTNKIRSADIVFFTYPPNLYRVTSSGAYFDAVACGAKIVAYQDNQFFAYEKNLYPNLMLCRDKYEMLDLIIKESENIIKSEC
jgi:hypothetical protein